ncbi:hypothetical protein ACFY1J_24085 [Streptomyces sp. NPDC001406]|uniref:hypothetical protein n=1 Tax=Streptomyces sp. NPDC001406 TaxID=3364572 RepID=UPI00368CE686
MAAVRAKVPASHLTDAEKQLAEFFRTQGAAVTAKWPEPKSRKGIADVFSLAHWNKILTPDLFKIVLRVSAVAAASVLAGLDEDPAEYDEARTHAWLLAHASAVAASVNGRTRQHLRDLLTHGSGPDDVRQLFAGFETGRAPQIARTEVTAATGFGTREAAHQVGIDLVKTWKTGRNPRQSHARMDGQSRPMGELFSNGARWPGDSLLDDKERSNCNCSMTVDRPTS